MTGREGCGMLRCELRHGQRLCRPIMARKLDSHGQTLAADWFAVYGEQVMAALTSAFPGVDRELRYDAFVQALIEIAGKPEAVDPSRGSVCSLLIGAAKRILGALHRSDQARRAR